LHDYQASIYGIFMVREATVVPVPAAVWLFASGLLGLVGIARRRKTS
jgi:fumarate reductase subunit C